MKQLLALLVALAMIAVVSSVSAGTMRNRDSVKYEIYKKSSGGGVHTSINGNTTQMSTCSYFPCTIKLKKTGQAIKLTSKDQNVEIKDGKLIVK